MTTFNIFKDKGGRKTCLTPIQKRIVHPLRGATQCLSLDLRGLRFSEEFLDSKTNNWVKSEARQSLANTTRCGWLWGGRDSRVRLRIQAVLTATSW